MEGLVCLVAESLERHGMPVLSARIEWSAWIQFESSLCLTAPSQPGLFVVAERVVPHGLAVPNAVPNAALSSQLHPASLLAIFILKIGQARDLGVEMGRLCSPYSPLHARIAAGHCLVRYAAVEDAGQRSAAHAALQQWCSSSVETSTDAEFPPNIFSDGAAVPGFLQQHSETQFSAEPQHSDSAHKRKIDNPAPLPSGF